jgi:hypothetical protein
MIYHLQDLIPHSVSKDDVVNIFVSFDKELIL